MRLYTGERITFTQAYNSDQDSFGYLWVLLKRIRSYKNIDNDNYDDGKITEDGYFRGKKLCGDVKVVDSVPDFRVKVVDSLPDLRVKKVDSSPYRIGEWRFVDSAPDFTIQYVDSTPDFTIQFVDSTPGVA